MPVQEELVRLGHFLAQFQDGTLLAPQKLFLFAQGFGCLREMSGDFRWIGEKHLQFVMENPLKIDNWNLVVALPAQIFGGATSNIHFPSAGAPCNVTEGVGRELARGAVRLPLFFDDLVYLVPEGFRHNRFASDLAPFGFGFFNVFPAPMLFDSIEDVEALGGRFDEHPPDMHVPPEFALASPRAGGVQDFGNGSLAAMVSK